LARGRFGGRPLYYASLPLTRALLVCSEIAPLVRALESVSLNADRLCAAVTRTFLDDQSQTHYREIRRVPSACVLRMGADGVRARHSLSLESTPHRVAPADVLADALRERVFAAVSRAMAPADDVGVLVGGGVDSSALLATALAVSQRSGKRVRAYSLDFGGEGDDRPHLTALCERLGVTPTRVKPGEGSRLFEQLFVVNHAPIAWPSAAAEVSLMQRIRGEGASVILTGSGGDDVFGGDLRLFAHRARQGHVLSAVRSAASLKAWGSSTAMSRVRALVVRPLLKEVVPRRLRRPLSARWRLYHAPKWAGPRLRDLIRGDAFERDSPRDGESPDDRSWLDEYTRSGLALYLSEARAQTETASGCARAEPFIDDEIVEFLASLRPDALFDGHWVRGLFRRSLRGLIPESVRLRPDKASIEPAFHELIESAGGYGVLERLASATALGDLGIVAPRPFRGRFDALVRNPMNGHLWAEVWGVLTAEAFVRKTSA
jgi:asparagine synthase (glutamine-hydrolysing)